MPQKKPKGRQPSPVKREAIFNAAINAFSEAGFEQTSMDTIAELAGVSKRTVYNHFESKDILFEELVQRLKERCLSASRIDYQSDRSLADQLKDFGHTVVDFHCQAESRRVGTVILPRLLQKPELGRSLFGDTRFFERELVGWLEEAVADKRMKCDDPSFAARQFLGILESFVVWPQLLRKQPSPSKANRKKLVERTVKLFLHYYEK